MNAKELIDRLRACPERGRNTIEAADALEAQAKYILELEDAVTPELVALRAQVADYEANIKNYPQKDIPQTGVEKQVLEKFDELTGAKTCNTCAHYKEGK